METSYILLEEEDKSFIPLCLDEISHFLFTVEDVSQIMLPAWHVSMLQSLRAMIARLESLVRQQREQRESVPHEMSWENSVGRGRRANMWELRDRHLWLRGDGNSGSDSGWCFCVFW
jgi:hypothetical protein